MIHITNDYLNLKQKRRINRTSRQEADRTNIPNTHVNYFEDGLDHVRLPFAYKLHILLCDMEAVGNEHIISWVEDGNAFKIHDPHTFKEIIQPRYFRQSKTSSFVRQCCMYGFSKIEGGPNNGSFVHPDFHKNDQAKTLTMKRRHSSTRIRRHCGGQVQEVVRSHCSTESSSSSQTTSCTTNTTPKRSWSGIAPQVDLVRLGACVAAPTAVTPLGSSRNNSLSSRDPSPVPCCASPRTTTTICSRWSSTGSRGSVGVLHPDEHDHFLSESKDHSSSLFEDQQRLSIGNSFGNVVSMSMVTDHESEFEPRPIELMLHSYYSVRLYR